MPSKKQLKNNSVYQIKVTLKGIRPPIWRRFQVESDTTLYELHLILQAVMGWENYHLYQFTVDSDDFGDADMDYGTGMRDASEVELSEIVRAEKQKFTYEYDFGDSWEHEILIEKILQPESGTQYPVCIAGKRACPPEDCGGIWGYTDLLEIIKDPNHEEYEDMMDWLGGDFDPQEFDLDSINKVWRH